MCGEYHDTLRLVPFMQDGQRLLRLKADQKLTSLEGSCRSRVGIAPEDRRVR